MSSSSSNVAKDTDAEPDYINPNFIIDAPASHVLANPAIRLKHPAGYSVERHEKQQGEEIAISQTENGHDANPAILWLYRTFPITGKAIPTSQNPTNVHHDIFVHNENPFGLELFAKGKRKYFPSDERYSAFEYIRGNEQVCLEQRVGDEEVGLDKKALRKDIIAWAVKELNLEKKRMRE